MSEKHQSSPQYTRSQAARLICACYNKNGADVNSDVLKRSILEDSLGELPDTWNVGLFRFLDESIYLIKYLGYFALATDLQDKTSRSIAILIYQIEKNLLAVRVLSAAGLDASARQNLRALFEMCQSLCRCVVDQEFSEKFSEPQTPVAANKFWHEFISKEKTAKFLKRYNEENEDKCLLVVEGVFESASNILGVSAHPNFLGWRFDFGNDWTTLSAEVDQENMFQFNPVQASELVLTTAAQIAFLTFQFYTKQVAEKQSTLGLLSNNPMFKHCESDTAAIETIGKNSAMMFLMLCKLVNREKPNFDAELHY